MAQYTERLWTQTKDTEQLTFVAGEDLPYLELVKETGPNTNVMIIAASIDEAVGYVLSPKGALSGQKVDIHMLARNAGGGGGGGSVNSVTGLAPNVIVDNTDPANPIVAAGTQSWEWSGSLTTPILSNIQNDYTQAGMANITELRVEGDLFDPPFFYGFSGGTPGRILIINNAGPVGSETPIYFYSDDGVNSLPQNRILFQGLPPATTAWPLYPNGKLILQYDGVVQRWKVIGRNVVKIVDDGQGIVTVGGDEPFPIIGFNGVFTDGITITGTGTPFSPLTAVTTSDTLINLTYFVDPFYGNDGTAIPNSMTKKYQTIDAALAAGGVDRVIHLMPGNHVMTTQHAITFSQLKIYMEPGAVLLTLTGAGTPAFTCDPGLRLTISGQGTLQLDQPIFRHANPSSLIPAELFIECDYIDSNSQQNIFEFSGVIARIWAYQIADIGHTGVGWCDVSIATDYWTLSSAKIFNASDFISNSGNDYYSSYGQQKFSLKGRTKPRAKILNQIQNGNCIYTQAEDVDFYKTFVDIHADFDSTDGFFTNIGRGIARFNGNLVHRKSDLAGNEVPWMYCDQTITDDRFAPDVWHQSGSWVSGTNNLFGGSQNNEIASIRCLGKFRFSGKYNNLGENTGLGAWPIVEVQNTNTSAGNTDIILDGDFKNFGKDVAPIVFKDQSNPGHTWRCIVDKATIETSIDGETINSNVAMLIYVLHSLSMNVNYNALITDAFSVNRTMVDRQVMVSVPEYGQ